MKYMPATNVIFALIAGILSTLALRLASSLGYDAPEDVANALPGAIALLVAHLWDIHTGQTPAAQAKVAQYDPTIPLKEAVKPED